MQEDTPYIDARGAEMPRMNWSEALAVIHDLARQNQPGPRHIQDNPDLAPIREWQETALVTLSGLLKSHGEALDGLEASYRAGEWPDSVTAPSRDMDTSVPSNALRVCLDLAEDNMLDPRDARDIDMAEEVDRQQQCSDMARDFLGMHAGTIDAGFDAASAPKA